jgi:glycosyltransferase involved in cell wall biosynthesis
MKKYFDISDLLLWFATHKNPSGVQRVSIEAIIASKKNLEFKLAWFDFENYCWNYIENDAHSEIVKAFELGFYGRLNKINLKKSSKNFVHDGNELYSLGMNWFNKECIQFSNFKYAHPNNKVYIYIHDVIPFTHTHLIDINFAKHWRNFFVNILNFSDILFCSTEFMKSRIQFLLKYKKNRIIIIVNPYGIDHFRRNNYIKKDNDNNSNSSYLVCIGTIDKRKNQYSLLEPWRKITQLKKFKDFQLVFIGRLNDTRVKTSQNIKIYDSFSDNEIISYIEASRAAIFPSLAEGFGLPAFESTMLSTPTISSPLPEILEHGKDSFNFFKNLDSKSIEYGLHEILETDKDTFFSNKFLPKLTWETFCNNLFYGEY